MASLAEELKLLSLPAPGKINLDNFEDDLTRARVISKDDIYANDSETVATTRSNLRRNAAKLLADEDLRYAGKAISRKQQLKLRGDSTDELAKELSDDDASSSEYEKSQDLQAMLEEKYEFQESLSDQSENEASILVEDERGENDEVENMEENGGEEDGNEEYESGVESEEEISEEDEELGNEDMKDCEVKEQESGKYEEVKKFTDSDKDDIEKGEAVVHQIALWDSLLENRIRLQKMLVEVNKMPQHNLFNEMKENGGNQIKSELNNTQELLTNLLHNLLILQQTLFEKNSDMVGILMQESKAIESDEDIPSNDEDSEKEDKKENNEGDQCSLKLTRKRKHSMQVDEYSEYIVKRHAAFENFRDATIKKWNEKTRLASGKISNKSFSSFDRSTLNQIKQILSDKDRLIKRTQLKRSSYRVLGKMQVEKKDNSMEERDIHLKDYDSEIFDDDDFYHQLLREFIERKSNVDSSDPIAMGRQWLEIQRLRNKVKRKVDTKASKGRRLRYDVHTKLVSFMAPQNKGTMTDSSRNELFSSLFGKRQPQETADINLFS